MVTVTEFLDPERSAKIRRTQFNSRGKILENDAEVSSEGIVRGVLELQRTFEQIRSTIQDEPRSRLGHLAGDLGLRVDMQDEQLATLNL